MFENQQSSGERDKNNYCGLQSYEKTIVDNAKPLRKRV